MPVYIAATSVAIAALSFVPGAREGVDWVLGRAGRYLFETTPVPRFIVALLVLAAVPSLLPLWQLVRRPPRSYRKAYTSMRHLSVVWRWRYSAVDRSVEGIEAHCPHDDARLEYVASEGTRRGEGLLLACPVCGRTYGPLPGPPRALLDRVQRLIRHEIATAGWREG